MSAKFPKPGNGFTIREYLGGGNHKEAYRASSLHYARDVALIYFRQETADLISADFQRLMRVRRKSANAEFVAQLIGFNTGLDGRSYLIEELLSRSLDRVGPVDDDIIKFARIARDLFRGLEFLHSVNVVHRDLKMDNCGLDSQERAKIFDLGCLTTDPGDIKGNVFTREPRLFRPHDEAVADKAADIWAMGATLFALRTSHYPFSDAASVAARRQLNEDVHEGLVKPEAAAAKKAEWDQIILNEVFARGGERKLMKKVDEHFRGDACELMKQALVFDSTRRPDAAYFADEWTSLCNRLNAAEPAVEDTDQEYAARPRLEADGVVEAEQFLRRVCDRELSITEKQLQRTVDRLRLDDPEQEDPRLAGVRKLVQQIKRKKLFADQRLGVLQQ